MVVGEAEIFYAAPGDCEGRQISFAALTYPRNRNPSN
jgi:hypothetical protein